MSHRPLSTDPPAGQPVEIEPCGESGVIDPETRSELCETVVANPAFDVTPGDR
ncbi:MAG: hypothetical protein ACOC0Z_04695 [Halohasta sp.]